MNRRRSLKLIAGAAGAIATSGLIGRGPALAQTAPATPAGPFKLPALGYAYEALEPNIDAQTMTIHHQRHHGAFITNLNGLVGKYPELASVVSDPVPMLADLSKVPLDVRGPVRNNLGGHWNHTFFWELMTPGGTKEPSGDVKGRHRQRFRRRPADDGKAQCCGARPVRFGLGLADRRQGQEARRGQHAVPGHAPYGACARSLCSASMSGSTPIT